MTNGFDPMGFFLTMMVLGFSAFVFVSIILLFNGV